VLQPYISAPSIGLSLASELDPHADADVDTDASLAECVRGLLASAPAMCMHTFHFQFQCLAVMHIGAALVMYSMHKHNGGD